MTNALVSIADMKTMADSIVKSRFYGFKTVDEVLAIMCVAQAENKHPATVVQEYDIIQGRPALKSSAALARFQLAGGKVQWDEVSAKKARGTFTHPAGGTLTIEWTIEMAQAAGLVRPGSGWAKYPEDMLCARVAARAIRKVYPACLTGSYLVEEVADFDKPLNAPAVEPPKIPVASAPVAPPVIEGKAEPAQESDSWPLMVPNLPEPYMVCTSPEEWVDSFNELVTKISRAPKYSAEQRSAKLKALIGENQQLINSLHPDLQAQVNQELEP